MSDQWNQLFDAFVKSIKAGESPQIESFLPADIDSRAERDRQLRELLAIEVVTRKARGESPSADDYRERFPADAKVIEKFFASATVADKGVDETMGGEPDFEVTMDLSGSQQPSAGGGAPHVSRGKKGEFGDYELIEEIARGGMGVVYRARHIRLNRTVALKMILTGQLANETEVERFYSEARAAANLDHPGILPVYEINQLEDQHFFTMALAEGGSLADVLREGPTSPKRAAELVSEVAAAVQHAHENGIVHRDLKPANILLDSHGRPKVTDFGLAKQVDGDSHMTATGQILGTPSYMPPEQAKGDLTAVDARSDVYALGAVLYALLTGRPPFETGGAYDVIQQVLTKDPVAPRKINPRLPLDLEIICLRCLEKEPKRRLQSAGELADELNRFLDHEPILSRPISSLEKLVRWGVRRPLWVGLAASILLAIAATFIAGSIYQEAQATRTLSLLTEQIEAEFDAPNWTSERVAKLESLLVQLAELAPDRLEATNERFERALRGDFDRMLRKPKLSAEDRERIDKSAELIVSRSPTPEQTRADLRSVIENRLRVWEPLFELTAPFDNHADVFPQSRLVDGRLRLHASPSEPRVADGGAADDPSTEDATNNDAAKLTLLKSRTALSQVECDGNIRLEVAFPSGWENYGHLGVVLNGEGKQGYAFLLSPQLRTAKQGTQTIAPTFANAARQKGAILVRIFRSGLRLTDKEIPFDEVPTSNEPLHLTASRQGDQLSFQINAVEPIRLRDLFPINASTPGRFGVYLPREGEVVEVRATRQSTPRTPSPLEQADALFAAGDFREAMRFYAQQAIEAEEESIGREALYKEGLCHAELKRFDEAEQRFTQLSGSADREWSARAACQLWLLQLRQNKDDEADVTLQSLSSLYTFEELAVLIPPDDRDRVLEKYEASTGGGYRSTIFNKTRLRNLERLVAVHRVLRVSDGARFDGQRALMTEYLRQHQYADAAELAEELLQEDWITPGGRWFLIADCVWLARQTGNTSWLKKQIERSLYEADGATIRRDYLPLMIELARLHVIDGDWETAEQVAAQAYEGRFEMNDSGLYSISLLYGFILDHQGRPDEADQVWKSAYDEARKRADVQYLLPGIIGSLVGEIQMQDAQRVITGVGQLGSGPYLSYLQNRFVPMDLAQATLNNMWRQSRGRSVARDIAFRDIGFWEAEYIQVAVCTTEVWRQCIAGTFDYQGDLPPEQEEIIWNLSNRMIRRYQEGKLREQHMLLLALAWKGTTNVFGWDGFASLISDRSKAELGYVLACRYARQLNQIEDARKLLLQAQAACESDWPVAAMIAAEIERLPAPAAAPTPGDASP